MDRPDRQRQKWWKRARFLWAAALAACALAFAAGWCLSSSGIDLAIPHPLRLTGKYEFISPLLACNFNSSKAFPPSASLDNTIQAVVTKHKNQGDIEKASVYFADFSAGTWASVNGSEKYYPSSLGKVPIMMAYLALTEDSSTLLDERVTYPLGSTDLNGDQEIKPEQAIVPGNTYTISSLIDYMIKYSDNNAADLLYNLANQSDLANIYSDLQVPVSANVTTSTLDFMTPQQYSILFRTLYNSTYLTREESENALKLMSQTSFAQGLVAGVPDSTVVAHKFGIVSFLNGGVPQERELHDCGITYAPGHPYLLCVMTRGSSALPNMEATIADISRSVYNSVESGN